MQRLLAISLCLIIALSACIPSFGQQTDAGGQDVTTGDTGGDTKDTTGDAGEDTSDDTAEVTQDPVAEPVATVTSTPKPEPTNTPGPPWAGNWTIAIYGSSIAGIPGQWQDKPMTCAESGQEYDVTCNFEAWGYTFAVFGNIHVSITFSAICFNKTEKLTSPASSSASTNTCLN